jgi:RNA polymerase sigma-70 factor, ECF subfamily
MKCINDRELLAQLQQGNLDSLGELYYRYCKLVFRTAYAITGDAESARDLVQDVFLRVHRFADYFDLNRPLEPWLYRITANLSSSFLKQRRRRLHLLNETYHRFKIDPEDIDPDNIAEKNETWDQIYTALLATPLRQRVVVVMYYINDLSIQEISEILDIPIGTVKSRLHYGREMLKCKIKLMKMLKGWYPMGCGNEKI